MKLISSASLALFGTIASALFIPSAQDPPASLEIRSITTRGNGCPVGTIGSSLSTDKSSITIIFNELEARYDGVVSAAHTADIFESCTVSLGLSFDAGYQFGLKYTTLRGVATLQKDVRGQVITSYIFRNTSFSEIALFTLDGPADGIYTVTQTPSDINQMPWSPCGAGAILNIKEDFIVTSTNISSQGVMKKGSIYVASLIWRTC